MANGPDFRPLLQALQAYAAQETQHGSTKFDAATQMVRTTMDVTERTRKWDEEDETEELLKNRLLSTPAGDMDAYTLAKLSGQSAFDAVRSMVLSSSEMQDMEFKRSMRDFLTLLSRDIATKVPEQVTEGIAAVDRARKIVTADPVDEELPSMKKSLVDPSTAK